jgi:hypothetical protein
LPIRIGKSCHYPAKGLSRPEQFVLRPSAGRRVPGPTATLVQTTIAPHDPGTRKTLGPHPYNGPPKTPAIVASRDTPLSRRLTRYRKPLPHFGRPGGVLPQIPDAGFADSGPFGAGTDS